MTNLSTTNIEFTDFPEDVQLSILSFLTPSEISSFASTSKRFLALCRSDSKLWFSLCHRRFGSKTHITKWGNGNITFKSLYKTLIEYENLIGFWRLSSSSSSNQTQTRTSSHDSGFSKVPGLVFFEWGESFITGFKVSPSKNGSYDVVKEPFLYMGISPKGEIVNFLEMGMKNRSDMSANAISELIRSNNNDELVSVDVNHMGQFHIVIEERVGFGGNVGNDELVLLESGSPPDRITSEIYQYFANRTSPSGRRQRRREKERNGNKKWEAEHFVKIVNYGPTSLRPLQGLWKGICEDANLDFYLVAYDDIGGIACRRIGDSCKPFSSYAPVFWTSNTTFFESPFSSEEESIFDTREHLLPPGHLEMEAVSRILYINSSYDLVLPGLVGPTTVNPHQVEGRIWQYGDGTFGFGFLRDNHIIDLKHIAVDGCLLDAMQPL